MPKQESDDGDPVPTDTGSSVDNAEDDQDQQLSDSEHPLLVND